MEQNEIIYGKNAVEAVLETGKRNVNKIYMQKGMRIEPKIKNIINLARSNNLVIQEVPREKLNMLAGQNHQGIAASVSPIEYLEFDDFLIQLEEKTENALVIILDGVEDPHNLGAIIRTAAAAGADGVVIPKRRSTPVTAVVEKASAGALESIPIVQVSNINLAIEQLQKQNFWIVGAESSGDKYYFDIDYKMNCAIVMGGEDKGISNLVKKNCDFWVKIPMPGNINSLNVSNATSILIYEVIRQRLQNCNLPNTP